MAGEQFVGLRRLWALVEGLPPDGALARAIGRRWAPGSIEELLAAVVETNWENVRATLLAGGAKSHQVPKSLHVPRPGDDDKPREIPVEKLGEYLAELRRAREEG